MYKIKSANQQDDNSRQEARKGRLSEGESQEKRLYVEGMHELAVQSVQGDV